MPKAAGKAARARQGDGRKGDGRKGKGAKEQVAAGPAYIRERISVFFASNSSGEMTPWSRSSASLTSRAAWSSALAAPGPGDGCGRRCRGAGAAARARAGSPPGPAS